MLSGLNMTRCRQVSLAFETRALRIYLIVVDLQRRRQDWKPAIMLRYRTVTQLDCGDDGPAMEKIDSKLGTAHALLALVHLPGASECSLL